MLGALVLGAVIFIKVLPQIQQAAAAPGAAPAAAGGGVWAQVPNTTTCGMIGAACPTLGVNDPTGWCICQAGSTTTTPAPASAPALNCAGAKGRCIAFNGGCVIEKNSNCPCSGCKQTHASSTKNKPSSTQPKTLQGTNPRTGTSVPSPNRPTALTDPFTTRPSVHNPGLGTIVPGLA